MTVKSKRPHNLADGAYPVSCDICGALWYSDRLTRKNDGLLYCPKDVGGADSVTLSKANAADSARAQRRDARPLNPGSTDTSGDSTRIMPNGILGTNLSGWWGYRNLKLGSGVREATNTPHQLAEKPGNLDQIDVNARPAFDGEMTITFDGTDDYLSSPARELVQSGAFPTIWVVGSFTDPDNSTASTMFTLSDVGAFMTYTASAPNRVYLQAQNGAITVGFSTLVGSDLTASYSFSSTAEHLWEIRVQSDRIEIYEDGTLKATTMSAGISSLPFSYMFMGAGVTGTTRGAATTIATHDGTCNEIVLSKTTVTADNVSDIETYIGRNFTGLTIA